MNDPLTGFCVADNRVFLFTDDEIFIVTYIGHWVKWSVREITPEEAREYGVIV